MSAPGRRLVDLRRVAYGLDAILRLHTALEELYVSLGDDAGEVPVVNAAGAAA